MQLAGRHALPDTGSAQAERTAIAEGDDLELTARDLTDLSCEATAFWGPFSPRVVSRHYLSRFSTFGGHRGSLRPPDARVALEVRRATRVPVT